MRVDVAMLYYLEKDQKIFGGPWVECDNYGNTKPGSASYPTLAAFNQVHVTGGNTWVSKCVYCYKNDEIARIEAKSVREQQELEKGQRKYAAFAKEYEYPTF